MDHSPQAEDIATLLLRVVEAPQQLAGSAFVRMPQDGALRDRLAAAEDFARSRLAPLHRSGDEAGCRLQDGKVQTPPGFRDAYEAFQAGGWPALGAGQDNGDAPWPGVVMAAIFELFHGANHGWAMVPGLLPGVQRCLQQFGDEALRQRWLPLLARGDCLASLCIAEAQSGSELDLLRTEARPQEDGSHRLYGTKVFVTGGDHDLGSNILHFVVARTPQAVAGTKGLTLYLVPRQLPDGSPNAIACERIEDKMGIHGTPTCTLRLDGAVGWQLGDPHDERSGLRAVQSLLESTRLQAALQGLGLLEAAWQIANRFAHEQVREHRLPEELQPRHAGPMLRADHPAIRRILDTQRAWIDGGRVLVYQSYVAQDLALHHPDAGRRAAAARWCGIATPMLKAALTHQAFHGASDCLQVLGGHGYVRDWEVEQIVRDARMTMIHDSSNEGQAIELLVRKVVRDRGEAMGALLADLGARLDAHSAHHSTVLRRFASMQMLTAKLVSACNADPAMPYWIAEDYLRAVTLVLMAWAWLNIHDKLQAGDEPATLPPRWAGPGGALRRWVLPEFDMRLSIIARRIANDTGPMPLA